MPRRASDEMTAGESPRRSRRAGLIVLAILLSVITLVVLYFTQLQPGILTRVDEIEIELPREAGPHRLFVYGTLRNQLVRFVVTGRTQEAKPTRLPGFRREDLDIIRDPDATVPGYVIYVSDAELRRLDRYERTGQRYERFRVTLEDGTSAWAYRLLPHQRPDSTKSHESRLLDGRSTRVTSPVRWRMVRARTGRDLSSTHEGLSRQRG